jgi:glutaconyl-CoA decarboxylase
MRRYTLEVRGRQFVIDVQELASDRFEVVVGDQTYEVGLSDDEDLPEATITPQFSPARLAAVPFSTPAPVRASENPADNGRDGARAPASLPRRPGGAGSGTTLNAPMPGVILEVLVTPGASVERGQVVAVLEAMKMKNNIKSARTGTVAEVLVNAGQAVGHGDALVRFEEG